MRDPEKAGPGDAEPLTELAIWDAIRDLDSPSDYREFLPESFRYTLRPRNNLVLLDEIHCTRWANVGWISVITALVCVILLLILRS